MIATSQFVIGVLVGLGVAAAAGTAIYYHLMDKYEEKVRIRVRSATEPLEYSVKIKTHELEIARADFAGREATLNATIEAQKSHIAEIEPKIVRMTTRRVDPTSRRFIKGVPTSVNDAETKGA